MKKRHALWAIVFGAMLAITGCGDDEGGDSGTGGGGGGGDFCTSLCEGCGGSQAECEQGCEFLSGSIPSAILDTCPSELDALSGCYTANDCDGDACESEVDTWTNCVIGNLAP